MQIPKIVDDPSSFSFGNRKYLINFFACQDSHYQTNKQNIANVKIVPR